MVSSIVVDHSLPPYHSPIFKKIYFIYLFMREEREGEREVETQAEGEARSMQGAQRGT